jgi:antitoxin ParD1/3/4
MEEHSELRNRLNDLVDDLVAEGRYKTGDDAVRAIAELLDAREKKIAALRAAIGEGEASGPFESFDFDEFIVRKMKERKKVSS